MDSKVLHNTFNIRFSTRHIGGIEELNIQGCISCGILVSGIRARGVSSEHMENMGDVFLFSNLGAL